jgi:Putative Ig domain
MENQQHLKGAFTGQLVQRIFLSRRISLTWFALALSIRWVEAQPSPDHTAGATWTGKAGVRETTVQIMAREAMLAAPQNAQVRVVRPVKPRFVRNGNNLPENPASPMTSHWPSSGGTAGSGPATAQTAPLTPQTVGTSFLGAQLSDTIGYVPPDSMADVGTNQIVVCVNGRIRTFNKNGAADGALDTTTDNFFASVLGGSSTSDPRVRFDRLSGRWFITMITVNTPNFVLMAVSSGPTITSTSSFTFFSFQADPSNFGDYDTLGVDANALYIGVNIFNGNTFVNTTGFVVNKANLLGGTLTVTTFANLIITSSGRHPQTHGPFTPQGVNNDDPAATQGYFIGVDATSFGMLVVRRISNPGGTPSISANILVTVPATGNPLGGVPALGSSQGLDDLDDRLFATRMHKGNLWTAHNIEVNASGTASSTGGRDGSRWYELTNMTGTPALVQSGTLFDPAASNPRSFWIPSCAMSGQGHMALGCSVAGNNEHAEIATAGRFATDPAGTLQSPTTAVTSSSTYNIGSQNNKYRWGDFSVTTVDPGDDMTFWTVQEYCNANDSWGVQVIKLPAPPPATPVGSSPSTVTQGVANVSVAITGSAAGGAGFFDPGTNFPNHISASVNGGGVTVDGVTYNNPTNITAVLTIAGNAAAGARTITIINPDGQSATSATGLLTVATVVSPTNQPPTLTPIPDQSVTAGTTLIVTNLAGDSDGDKLTFSLGTGAATNATINATNGIFSWTPMQSQAGTNHFSVIVTDNGSPPLSATQSFAVTVIATNTPPTLAPIASRTIHALMTLAFTNSASDPDVGETLTFSLDPGAPAGASIGATNGVFAWTPADSQTGTNDLTVRVTDNGLPPLSATQSFTVIVEPRPVLTIAVTNGIVTLAWSAIAGLAYQPQFNADLTDAVWTAFPSNVMATGPFAGATDTSGTNTSQYFRVLVVP